MRINMNSSRQNNFFNVSNNNQGLNQKNFAIKNSGQQKPKDTVSISTLGKVKSLIDSLMEQKQNIIERKNELIYTTLEKGENMDSIKPQLECFEGELKNINKQIAQTKVEQLKQQVGSQKEVAINKSNNNLKTEERIQTERLNSIVSLSSSLSQAQVVSSVKTKVDGESRSLEMEIKLDESRRGGASVSKKERLANLQKQSVDLTTKINGKLIRVSEEIKISNENQLIKPESSATTKDNELNIETKHKIVASIDDYVNA
ncbi:MAG: hypothetical protein PHI90_01620 [Clostridia bacterium]|nr:hypothetical protein [Clostridia bacterium]MDD4047524.1 hypothetical protein [Clostridia bacterium]